MCFKSQKYTNKAEKSSTNSVATKRNESGKMETALVRMLMASSIIPVQVELNNGIAFGTTISNVNHKFKYEIGYKIVKEERNIENGDFFINILLHALQCK